MIPEYREPTIKISKEYKDFSGSLWLGQEVSVNPTEDKQEVWRKAEQEMDSYYRSRNNPQPSPVVSDHYEGFQPERIPEQKQSEDQRIGVLVADINSCTELKVLESYKILAKTKPELQDAYDKKKKELVAKESKEIIDAADNILNKEERQELLRKADGYKSKN